MYLSIGEGDEDLFATPQVEPENVTVTEGSRGRPEDSKETPQSTIVATTANTMTTVNNHINIGYLSFTQY